MSSFLSYFKNNRQPLIDLPDFGEAILPKPKSSETISNQKPTEITSSSSFSPSSPASEGQVNIEVPEPSPSKVLRRPSRAGLSRFGRTVLFYLIYFSCLFLFLSLFLGTFFYLLSRGLVYYLAEVENKGRPGNALGGTNWLMASGSSNNNISFFSSKSTIPLDVLEAPWI